MQTLTWNVKNASNAQEALLQAYYSAAGYGTDAKPAPTCCTRRLPLGQTIAAQRKRQALMQQVRAEALDNGNALYANQEALAAIVQQHGLTWSPRRGYGVLNLNMGA